MEKTRWKFKVVAKFKVGPTDIFPMGGRWGFKFRNDLKFKGGAGTRKDNTVQTNQSLHLKTQTKALFVLNLLIIAHDSSLVIKSIWFAERSSFCKKEVCLIFQDLFHEISENLRYWLIPLVSLR